MRLGHIYIIIIMTCANVDSFDFDGQLLTVAVCKAHLLEFLSWDFSYWRDVLVTACVTSSASRFAPMTSQSPASPAYHPRLNLRTFGFWTVRPNQKTPLQCRRLWMLWPTSTSGWRSRLGVLFLSYFGSRLVWSWIWGFVPLQNFADGVHTHTCIVMYTY